MKGQGSTTPKDLSRRRRFYKTGDLVRYTSEEHIIYLGRKDTQVKIHGQRVEVDEIEHHLLQCPRVRQGAIFYPSTGPFRNSLVSVIQLAGVSPTDVNVAGDDDLSFFTQQGIRVMKAKTVQGPPTREAIERIQEQLSRHMPAYMVPKATVVLERMPMSSAAKLDRKLIMDFLQSCDQDTARDIKNLSVEGATDTTHGAQAAEQPLTPTAELMRSLWAKLLNLPVEAVKPTSSFLRSGGDSILALQLVVLARRQCGLLTSVHDILNSKTLIDLAQKSGVAQDRPIQSALTRSHECEPFDLSPIQRFYFELDETGKSLQTQSFTLACPRGMQVRRLQKAVELLVATHGMLRARFSRGQDGAWSQRVLEAHSGVHHHFAHHAVAQREAAERIAETTRRTMDIEHGPVFGVDYFDIGDTECILFLVAHHLVVDLVSWRAIFHDLEQLLQAKEDGRLAVPGSFRDWCVYQYQFAHDTLSSPGLVSLPFDVSKAPSISKFWNLESGKPNLYGDVISQDFCLDPGCSRVLLEDAPKLYGINISDILIAAVSRSLSQVLGETVLLHLEGHGREPPPDSTMAIANTVGWFTTMFPVFLSAAAVSAETGDMLPAIRFAKDLLKRIPQNGWQYFSAKYLVDDWRERLRHVQPEIMLNYHGRFHGLERGGDLFGQAPSLIRADDDPNARRPSLVNVEVSVTHNQLKVEVLWNRHLNGQDGVRKWLSELSTTLDACAGSLSRASSDELSLLKFPVFLGSVDQLNRATKGLTKDNVEDVLPLSPMQSSLLRSHRKGLGFYQTVWIWKVVSTSAAFVIDPLRLVQAWEKVVQLHQLLRTVFPRAGEEGFQVVLKKVEPATASFSNSADALARLESLQAFEYRSSGPATPWHRIVTCRSLSTGELFCRLDISHALTDGTAIDIILQDWATIYGEGDPAPPQTTFQDFLSYQRYASRQPSFAYWEKYLADIRPRQTVPTPVTVAQKTGTRRHHTLVIDTLPTADALLRCATAHGTTPANLFRSAWALVLRAASSPSSAREVTFAYLVHGRSIGPALEAASSIAAPLFNVLPCRVAFGEMAGSSDLGRFVRDMHADYARGMEHHDISIPEVVSRRGEGLTLESWDKSMTAVNMGDYDDCDVGWLFTSLVNFRRGTLPIRSGQECGEGIRSFEEVECADPMDYRFVLEVTQEADLQDRSGTFRAAVSFWEPDVPRAVGNQVAECVGLALKYIVADVNRGEDAVNSLNVDECVSVLRRSGLFPDAFGPA